MTIEKKTRTIYLRVSESQFQGIARRCTESGLDMPAYLRSLIARDIQPRSAGKPKENHDDNIR